MLMNHQQPLVWVRNNRIALQHYIDDIYSDTNSASGLRPMLYLTVRIGIFMALFLALGWELRHTALLPAMSYARPSIAFELVQHLISSPFPLLIAACLLALLVIRYHAAGRDWQTFEYGSQLRLFIVLLCGVSAWTYATYDFNLYFNQPHTGDRLLLLFLLVLVWWRPVFVLPFTVLLVSIINQFNFPLLGQESMWTEMNLLWQVLLLFAAMFEIYLVSGSRKTTDFIYVTCCLLAASYFRSGIGKLNLNWLAFPHIHFLMLGGYASGWLSFLSTETVVSVVQFLSRLAGPMMLMALVVEWGNLLILWRRSTTVFFLALFPLFHLGVFAISGIFFWKWMVLEIGLLAFFYRIRKLPVPGMYTLWHFVIALVLIGAGTRLFTTSNMSWYDTRLQYNYRYEAITAGGRHYNVPSNTFAPYIHAFTFGHFPYLSKDTQLTVAYGVTVNRDIANGLLVATSAESVYTLEKKYETFSYDGALAAEFDDFVARFMSSLNAHAGSPTWWKVLQPPAHLWSIPRPDEVWPDGNDPITTVIVKEVTTLYDDQQFAVIRERVVREVEIPQAGA